MSFDQTLVVTLGAVVCAAIKAAEHLGLEWLKQRAKARRPPQGLSAVQGLDEGKNLSDRGRADAAAKTEGSKKRRPSA